MKEWVDIEGSGELNTVITSGVTDQDQCFPQHPGTVNGANTAEMRFLTVRNTGTGLCSSAIVNNDVSPRLTHLTAEITGAGNTKSAVWNDNSSPTMTEVTATASGGTAANYGVWDQTGSSPTIRQSKLSGTTRSLWHDPSFGGGTAKVALNQLLQPVGGTSFQCFNNYDQNMAAVSCP